MSGVAGADRIRSREDYDQFVASYKKVISKFPGFESLNSSGSYNSNKAKTTFGDIDLVVHIKTPKSKVDIKKDLAQYFTKLPDTVIVPFSSPKYKGRKTYNSGEIVTVRYHDVKLGYSVQVDNIIALDKAEAVFKTSFLDLPAEKQGLILGLAKVILLEEPVAQVFARMGIKAPTQLDDNEEYEFNLSSIELQLRKVVYEPGSYVQQSRSVVWKTTKYTDVVKLFHNYNLELPFEKLMAQIRLKLHNPRSKQRIAGVFSSMISVKSGEVGTEKGANKQAAIDTVRKAFGEQRMITFKEYLAEAVEITDKDLKEIERYADSLFKAVNIDVSFTKHFLDRVNDARNIKQITHDELTTLFRKTFKMYGTRIPKLGPDAEAVINDMQTNINMPFVLKWDSRSQELDLVAKTIMRKKNFMTPDKKLTV